MVEKYLGEYTDDIFYSAMLTGLMNEKQAEDMAHVLEKRSAASAYQVFKDFLGGAGKVLSHGGSILKESPAALGKLALLGLGSGVVGATAYDVIKDKVTREDPKTELNAKIEAMYRGKKKELEDAQWMDRVRAMRDDLKRNFKKMPVEEYAAKYKALEEALDERK